MEAHPRRGLGRDTLHSRGPYLQAANIVLRWAGAEMTVGGLREFMVVGVGVDTMGYHHRVHRVHRVHRGRHGETKKGDNPRTGKQKRKVD